MKYKAIFILLSIIIITSAILSFVPIEKACGVGKNSCYVVQASQYEKTFGINNAYWGLVAFIILFIINLLQIKKPSKQKKQVLMGGLIIGSIVAIYFLYIQFFVLKAICKYCMVVDLGILITLGILIFVKDKY